MKKSLLPILLGLLMLTACKQFNTTVTDTAILVFYNVENLFDTIDDPSIDDAEFLPQGTQQWDTDKYFRKLKNMSDVLLSIDTLNPPALIGMAEVENRSVLEELISVSNLKRYNYQIIHKNSPDLRGIDVALIYRPEIYKPETSKWYSIQFPFDTSYKTRDILYSKGQILGDETIHIFINHWTSRYGGEEVTQAKRMYLGALLKAKADSIFKLDPTAKIIMMGDLNDNPTDASLTEGLKAMAVSDTIQPAFLYNISLQKFQEGEGSLFYRSWDMFDQIIVSGNLLLENSPVTLEKNSFQIHKPEWVLFYDNNGVGRPNRTASGSRYYGGYSDHLPVYLTLIKNNSN